MPLALLDRVGRARAVVRDADGAVDRRPERAAGERDVGAGRETDVDRTGGTARTRPLHGVLGVRRHETRRHSGQIDIDDVLSSRHLPSSGKFSPDFGNRCPHSSRRAETREPGVREEGH